MQQKCGVNLSHKVVLGGNAGLRYGQWVPKVSTACPHNSVQKTAPQLRLANHGMCPCTKLLPPPCSPRADDGRAAVRSTPGSAGLGQPSPRWRDHEPSGHPQGTGRDPGPPPQTPPCPCTRRSGGRPTTLAPGRDSTPLPQAAPGQQPQGQPAPQWPTRARRPPRRCSPRRQTQAGPRTGRTWRPSPTAHAAP